jgi:hypothetical protein
LASRLNKILVLGNSPHINEIDFDLIDPRIKTIGVNRIWLKHYPNYFFFNDVPILNELDLPEHKISKIKLIQNSICYSSQWIRKSPGISIPNWVRIYPISDRTFFPDSVSNSIKIFKDQIIRGSSISDYVFYIAGVNLNWSDPSHFWKTMGYPSRGNHNNQVWYERRFNAMLSNFIKLKDSGVNMVSVTPGSRLNKIMRYENISNLYIK